MNRSFPPNAPCANRPLFARFLALLLVLGSSCFWQLQAQTPGLIYKPAVNGGNLVMDPNGDGYLSTTRTGYVSNDETESEIPFRRVPVLSSEPIGDISTGGVGGHTDYTDHPLYSYFDGTNMLFRFRLSGQSTSSKGYSILIDANNNFSGTGTNPGFEYEVLLATNFSVQIINHTVSPATVIFTGNLDQYFQKSIALTQSHGDADYFYDIYVPLSAFKGGITATTPLRFVTTTITSAQSGISGTASDIGGVNDALYGNNRNTIWSNVISTFPPTSPSTIQTGTFPPLAAFAPVVSDPVKVGTTSISGTSAEAAGSTINVRRNGVSICGGTGQPSCPTVGTDGKWTLSGLASNLLVANDVITAVALVSGKTTSAASAGVTVTSLIPAQCSTPAPTLTQDKGGKGLVVTTTQTGEKLYQLFSGTGSSQTLVSSIIINATSHTFTFGTTGQSIPNGSYTATITPTGGCQSPQSLSYCHNTTKFAVNPVITSTALTTASTIVTGTLSVTEGYTIFLYVNGRRVTERTVAAGTSPSSWSIPFSGYNAGDIVYVRAAGVTSSCLSDLSNSISVTQAITAAPTITGTYNGAVTTITGTSLEAQGTSIQVFYTPSGSTTPISIGTTTVNANRVWSLAVPSGMTIPVGSTLTAVATAPLKQQSPASAPVTIGTTTSATSLAVTGPLIEGATTVRGTYSTPGATIRVYIDGALLVTSSPIVVAADGSWSVAGISMFELYAGARITATAQSSPNAESVQSAAVVVQCLRPVEQNISALTSQVCSGSMAVIQLAGSERGVIYDLYSKPAGSTLTPVKSGASAAGTGGAITLTSSAISQNTSFSVLASKISGAFCSVTLSQTATISIIALPNQGTSVVSGPSNVCANNAATITVTNTNPNFSYQLRTGTSTVGSPVMGLANGGTISLPSNPITVTTTYNVFVTDITTGCAVQFSPAISIPPTGPSATQSVTASGTGICVGGNVTIAVTTENNANFSYQIQQSTNNGVNWTPITTTSLTATFVGNGSTIPRTTTAYTSAGTIRYRVVVTNSTANTACPTVILVNQPEVVVSNTPTTSNAGASQTVCSTTARLNGNTVLIGTGAWTIVSTSPADPSPTVSVETPSSATSRVLGLKQGYVYTFQWTITSSCTGATAPSASTITITTNCPSVYTVEPAKFPNEYQKGNVLASLSDADGNITSASLIDGTNVPLGTTFNSTTGAVTVDLPGSLISGTYTFRVRAVDATGAVTVLNVTITFLGEIPHGTPLPVALVSLKAQVVPAGIRIDWRTASEQNNNHFLVAHSTDGIRFKTIGTVQGHGTTQSMQAYSFTDTNPHAGINYYRLVQVDYDGTETKTFVVSAVATGLQPSISVYPNPATNTLSIQLPAANATEALTIKMQDMQGGIITTFTTASENGLGNLVIDIRQLKAGMYLLTVEGPNLKTQVVRFVKLQ